MTENHRRLARVLHDVAAERARQDEQWGEQNHPIGVWLAILTEEVGEVAREIAECSSPYKELDAEAYRAELVQVAAVAVAAVENLDRSA